MDKEFKTSFPKLDSEHVQINDAILHLRNVCVTHFNHELQLYKNGLKRMPNTHKNTKQVWEQHYQQHLNFINDIDTLQSNLFHHIKTQDIPQFHFNK